MLVRGWRKWNLIHCWWELMKPLWKKVWRILKKIKKLPYELAIPLLGIYPDKAIIQKDTFTTMFKAALFTTAKMWKQPTCPTNDEWIKMHVCGCGVFVCVSIYSPWGCKESDTTERLHFTSLHIYIYIYIYIYICICICHTHMRYTHYLTYLCNYVKVINITKLHT